MDILDRIAGLEDFWAREFAYYLNEHQNPYNKLTHMIGIPIIVTSLVGSVVTLDWRILIGGQVVGWAFQLLGHRIEGNRPALLRRKISFLMGPLMVLVELAELLGMRFAFAETARDALAVTPA